MLSMRTLKIWIWCHTWSSLICMAFMLLLCVTGLPLIFHHEINHLTGAEIEARTMPVDTHRASLDRVLENAKALYPDRLVQFASQPEDDDRLWHVTLTLTTAPTEDFKSIAVDSRTGEVLGEVPVNKGFMNLLFRLHVDLLAGMPGKLFLGAMGLLLLLSIVSGVVLYAPFMRKLRFGEVRYERGTRISWLDLHNLLGIATLLWLTVVGTTGVVNAAADLLMRHWQKNDLGALLTSYKDQPAPPLSARSSMQSSLDAALVHSPGMKVAFIALPNTVFSSPYHNTFYLRGETPLTSRLLHPVLVDARLAQVTSAPSLPWYLHILLLSQPLHFGDYGGIPMKVLWALLDIAAILVLGSGLYLWLTKRILV